VPYVSQLPRAYGGHKQIESDALKPESLSCQFKRLRRKLGISRKLTAHDFRRTTAVKVYEATRDLRQVQALLGHGDLNSTLWYLDHHMTPVNVANLELAKLNPRTEVVQ
jgi:integrase